MKTLVFAVLVSGLVCAQASIPAATAQGPNEDSPPGDDLGIQLVDMLAKVADVLRIYQDQTANESYLGSAASSHRLQSALPHASSVSVRGARPFVQGWLIDDD